MALGGGDPDAVPAESLAVLDAAREVFATEAAGAVLAGGGRRARVVAEGVVAVAGPTAALDDEAHRLSRAHPGVPTLPGRETLRDRGIGAAVARLAAVGAELRRECPWDRVQTAETIVPHTVEEAFEVAEAVAGGDPDRLADELGDLLFQSVFLARLLEEDGGADLADVADGQRRKLISRHPHVYGDVAADGPDAVVDVWERQKRAERVGQGVFHDLPVGLPALAYATKTLKRAAAAGLAAPDAGEASEAVARLAGELVSDGDADRVGDLLLAAVRVARTHGVDPEIALRAAALRVRRSVEGDPAAG